MTDNPPVLGRTPCWTTRLPLVRRGAVAEPSAGSGVGVAVASGSASKAAAGSTTGGAVTGSSGNDSGASKGSTAVAGEAGLVGSAGTAGSASAEGAGAVGADVSCADEASAAFCSRLGSESGKKTSVESAVELFTWGCCFFF